MTSDKLLTEIERQKKYLDKLPDKFEFPLFNSKQAIESQRRNGYRNTAAAAREIVDNSLEAGAKKIHVCFNRAGGAERKAHGRTDAVSAVAFLDDGSGMLPDMARYALSWGGGTHFDEPGFIGRFGFGLPNASINQTERVEVYTRVTGDERITKAVLDIKDVPEHGIQTIPAPELVDELPAFVQRYQKENGLSFDHGTVVVWVQPDRLTYRTGASLKGHLVDDFGAVYRYLLDGIELAVEATPVEPVDPLFLDPRGRYFLPEEQGGACLRFEKTIAVRYYRDPETGGVHLQKVDDEAALDPTDKNVLAVGAIVVKVSRLPLGFAEHSKSGKLETDAHRRFEVRKPRRGISFVRAGREIETVDAFPRTQRDRASGLGHWPLLQGYAYHHGCEISFEPSLDEVFGITNDKQTVRPIEDLWRVLAHADVALDRALHDEIRWQTTERERRAKEEKKGKAQRADEPTPGESAAARADTVGGKRTTVPDRDKGRERDKNEEEARRRVGVTAKSVEEARAAIEVEAKKRPYVIDFFEDVHGPFYQPEWGLTGQVVVKINKLHPFFSALYTPVLDIRNGKSAIDLLLIALAKAELETDDEVARLWYEEQRKTRWSTFLAKSLKVLAQMNEPAGESGDTEQQADFQEARPN
jgi:hypothetical protein